MTQHSKQWAKFERASKDFQEICEAIEVSADDMRSSVRSHHLDRRSISTIMFRDGHSPSMIGTVMHKDHTTINHHLEATGEK